MGNKQVHFTEEQLESYQDCTFFTRKEILRIYKRYKELSPNEVPQNMSNEVASTFRIPHSKVEKMPEFKENPFSKRICQVFSEDGSGNMSFNDFLDMFSVFSEAAPKNVKAHYAFRIYDFDDDEYIGKDDLVSTIDAITRSELEQEEIDFICDKVFEEADLDDDSKLSYSEFEHVISRAPDFLSTFHIRI